MTGFIKTDSDICASVCRDLLENIFSARRFPVWQDASFKETDSRRECCIVTDVGTKLIHYGPSHTLNLAHAG